MLKLRGPLRYQVCSLVSIASHLDAQQTGSEVLGPVVDPTVSAGSNASVSNAGILLTDPYSVQLGRHSVRMGIDAKRIQLNGRFDLLMDGQYSFSDLTGLGVTSL